MEVPENEKHLRLDEYIREVLRFPDPHIQGAIFEKTSIIYLREFCSGYEYHHYKPGALIKYKMMFGLPDKDMGIDIVGLDVTSKIILLIQCKYTSDKNKTLTYGKDKLSHLMAMDGRALSNNYENWKIFSIVITTGKKIRVPTDRMQLIAGKDLDGRLVLDLKNWKRLPDNSPENIKKELRPYQIEIIEKMTNHFIVQDKRIGKINMATGTGKTFTILKYIEKNILNLRSPKVLIVTSSRLLVLQINEVFNTTLPRIRTLPISEDGETDPDMIAKSEAIIHISTYNSMQIPIQKCKYDLVIFDESHHTNSDNRQSMIGKISESKILYMTATERNLENVDLIAEYSIRRGIKEEYLSDYLINIFKIRLQKSDIDPKIHKYRSIIAGLFDKISEGSATKIVVYCNNQTDAKTFYNLIKTSEYWKNIEEKKMLDVLISNTGTQSKKKKMLENFKNVHISIIVNVHMLVEGIDIPEIDTVVFGDITDSKINVLQSIGRALRISPGKRYSNICLGIVVDDNTNNTKILSLLQTQQKKLAKVLHYLATEDKAYLDSDPEEQYREKCRKIYIDIDHDYKVSHPLLKFGSRSSISARTKVENEKTHEPIKVETQVFDSTLNHVENADIRTCSMTVLINKWIDSKNKTELLAEIAQKRRDKNWIICHKIWNWVAKCGTYPEYFRVINDDYEDTIINEEMNDMAREEADKLAKIFRNLVEQPTDFGKVFLLSLSKLIKHELPSKWKEAMSPNVKWEKNTDHLRITARYQEYLLGMITNSNRLMKNLKRKTDIPYLVDFIPTYLARLPDRNLLLDQYISQVSHLVESTFRKLSIQDRDYMKCLEFERYNRDISNDLLYVLEYNYDLTRIWTIYHFVNINEQLANFYRSKADEYDIGVLLMSPFNL